MHAGVDKHSAARGCFVEHRSRYDRPTVSVAFQESERLYPTQTTRLQKFFYGFTGRVEPPKMSDGEKFFSVFRGLDHPVALLSGEGHRLLAKDMNAFLQTLHR